MTTIATKEKIQTQKCYVTGLFFCVDGDQGPLASVHRNRIKHGRKSRGDEPPVKTTL